MEKEIIFQGMGNNPSDYDSTDGQMAFASELAHKGGFRKMDIPADIRFKKNGFKPIYIHKTSDKETVFGIETEIEKITPLIVNYPVRKITVISAYDIDDYKAGKFNQLCRLELESEDDFKDITSIGYMVVIALTYSIKYVVLVDGINYHIFDNRPPFLELYFSAVGQPTQNDGYQGDRYNNNKIYIEPGRETLAFSLDKRNLNESEYFKKRKIEFTEQCINMMHAVYNKAHEDQLSENNLINPILVRYGVKMFSGDYLNVSPPILLFPRNVDALKTNIWYNTRASAKPLNNGRNTYYIDYTEFDVWMYKIYLKIKTDENLLKWEKLILSVDVFLSEEIHLIDSNSDDFYYDDTTWGYGTGEYNFTFLYFYGKLSHAWENIPSMKSFYLVKSIPVKDIIDGKWSFNRPLFDEDNYAEKNILKNYLTLPTLTEQSTTNSDILCDVISSYNNRLLVSGYSVKLPDLFPLGIMVTKIYSYIGTDEDIITDITNHGYNDKVIIYHEGDNTLLEFTPEKDKQDRYSEAFKGYKRVYQTGKNKSSVVVNLENYKVEVQSKETDRFNYNAILLPIYYSYYHTRGSQFKIFGTFDSEYNALPTTMSIPLRRNDFLNTSYYFDFDYDLIDTNEAEITDSQNKRDNIQRNVIKASEVNSPMTFKDGNIAVCGNGEVTAVAANAMPVSTGQFGQYPIIAFTTEGVYSVKVDEEGDLKAAAPKSFDICKRQEAVTNVEDEIVFISETGVLCFSGGQRINLLDSDMGREFDINELPHISEAAASCGVILPDIVPLREYLDNAGLAYDGSHSRLIVYNPNHSYCYIYETKKQMWFTHIGRYGGKLNGGEHCHLIDKDGESIIDFSSRQVRSGINSMLLSRPLKLDAPDVLKTVRTVMVRGMFRKGHVRTMLWGSRDLLSWHYVGSSTNHTIRKITGTPYKYFRIGVFCTLEDDESITGCTIGYEPKMTNRIR